MIVVGKKTGRLANRIFLFAHFIANAIECGYEVWNPCFDEYAGYFKGTDGSLVSRFPARRSVVRGRPFVRRSLFSLTDFLGRPGRLSRFKRLLFPVLDIANTYDRLEQHCSLSGTEFTQWRLANRLLIVRGWGFRDPVNVVRHAAALREFFAPIDIHAQKATDVADEAKRDCDVLVGLHIRHGDYGQYLNGDYFYDAATYVALARQALDLWPSRRVKFVICSDARQDLSLFAGLDCVPGPNHLVQDLYTLAQCHYLIGPPSTYTGWASFYGSVPLYRVRSADARFSLDDFSVNEGAL
jgi:hypothetical protein